MRYTGDQISTLTNWCYHCFHNFAQRRKTELKLSITRTQNKTFWWSHSPYSSKHYSNGCQSALRGWGSVALVAELWWPNWLLSNQSVSVFNRVLRQPLSSIKRLSKQVEAYQRCQTVVKIRQGQLISANKRFQLQHPDSLQLYFMKTRS